MLPDERETALVVEIVAPELEGVYREAYPLLHGLGVPLHVTLLYPWVVPELVEGARPRLDAVVAAHPPFSFTLTELRTFPRAVWVAPEPPEPFVALTRAIEAAFPETPHWGGAFEDVIPHMTLADGVEEGELAATLERLRAQVEPYLPLECVAREVALLVEQEDGRMPVADRLPLG